MRLKSGTFQRLVLAWGMVGDITRTTLHPAVRKSRGRKKSRPAPRERVTLSRKAQAQPKHEKLKVGAMVLGTIGLSLALIRVMSPGGSVSLPVEEPQSSWALQVGSFSSEQNAEELSRQLERSGYDTSMTRSGERYQVLVPGFESREEASRGSEAMTRLGHAGSFPVHLGQQRHTPATTQGQGSFHVQVASFGQQENAQTELAKLKGQGYQVELERGQKDGVAFFRILVGGYQDRGAADQDVSEFRALGYQGAFSAEDADTEGHFQSHGFNFTRILSNEEFESTRVTGRQVQQFLEGFDSYLAGYRMPDGTSFSEHVVGLGRRHRVNPIVLLAQLQKESGLVQRSSPPPDSLLRKAMGYACTDEGGRPTNSSFSWQLEQAARNMRLRFDQGQQLDFPVTKKVDYGRREIQVDNAASHALLTYTPHTRDTKLNQVGGGNLNFRRIYDRFSSEFARL